MSIECIECKHTVSNDAEFCPNCGRKDFYDLEKLAKQLSKAQSMLDDTRNQAYPAPKGSTLAIPAPGMLAESIWHSLTVFFWLFFILFVVSILLYIGFFGMTDMQFFHDIGLGKLFTSLNVELPLIEKATMKYIVIGILVISIFAAVNEGKDKLDNDRRSFYSGIRDLENEIKNLDDFLTKKYREQYNKENQ